MYVWRTIMQGSSAARLFPSDHSIPTHTHTHTRLTALYPGLPGSAGTRKVKPIWILLKQETVSGSGISWGPYASLHLAPDRKPCQYPTTQFFTGWMPFLPPNQQRQSTEGIFLHSLRIKAYISNEN